MPDELITTEEEQQLAAAFDRLRMDYQEPEETNEPPEEPEEPSEEEEPDDESGETASDDIEIAPGVSLSRTQLLELHRLSEFIGEGEGSLRQTAAELEQARQRAAAVPAPAAQAPSYVPPAPPEGLDLDDPTIRTLWDNQVQLAQAFEAQRTELLRRANAEVVDGVERAVTDWNAKYKLSEQDLTNLRQSAAAMNIAPQLESSGKSIYESVVSTLEAAFWSNPNLRNQYLVAQEESTRAASAAQKAKERKLASLSGRGSSTSANKAPAEMSADERKAAMIADLAAAMER